MNNQINMQPAVMGKQRDKRKIRGILISGEPMSKHTSWRVGGPAERYYIAADIEDLSIFLSQLDQDEPIFWLGLGSNLLVRDGGIRGTVIAVAGVLDEIKICGPQLVKAGAGVTCNKLARYAAESGLSGVEFLAGIPGTIGGALAMNAGAFGSETWDRVTSVETMNSVGDIRYRNKNEFRISYRDVSIPADEWFISAQFELDPDITKTAKTRIRKFLSERTETQPTGESSCGSVFRNPPGDHAGRLIDTCGLKGVRSGNARVSEIHANFIINDGGASAADIENLIGYVQQQVKDKTGVELVPEVRIIGETDK